MVYKRLVDCGAGDFCLELHSDKTHKTDILSKIINTLNLGSAASDIDFEEKANEIKECIDKLQGEIDAMHRKRYLGFSLYDDTYEVSCEMERKRVECAIMIKAALADADAQ